jgi:hypothetical protein
MIIVRYADDIIVGFEHEIDARRFREALREHWHEESDTGYQRGGGAAPIPAHQALWQLSERPCGDKAFVPRDQKCRSALSARDRMDVRQEPVPPALGSAFRQQDDKKIIRVSRGLRARRVKPSACRRPRHATAALDCSARLSKLADLVLEYTKLQIHLDGNLLHNKTSGLLGGLFEMGPSRLQSVSNAAPLDR